MNQVKLSVSGMSCNGCVNSVRTIVSKKLGIDKDHVEVSLDDATALVATDEPLDPQSDPLADTLDELERKGFPAQLVE